MRTTRRRSVLTTATAGLVAASAVGLAACGSSSSGSGTADKTAKLAPTDAARAGFSGLGEQSALTATFTIDADPATLRALDVAEGEDPTPESVYQLITGGSVVVSEKVASGTLGSAATSGANDVTYGITVNAGDDPNLVQLLYAAKMLYARADVAKIESYTKQGNPGSDPEGEVQKFLSSSEAKRFPFLADAVAGKWLKIDLGQVSSFLKELEPNAVPSASPQQSAKLQAALGRVFAKDVTATRLAADPTLGDHLVLSANARTLATDAVAAVKSELSEISPQLAKELSGEDTDTSDVEDKTITLDEYVSDGKVSEIALPLAQFVDDPKERAVVAGKPFRLVVRFTAGAPIAPPASATTIDVPGLIGKLGALGLQDDSSSSGL